MSGAIEKFNKPISINPPEIDALWPDARVILVTSPALAADRLTIGKQHGEFKGIVFKIRTASKTPSDETERESHSYVRRTPVLVEYLGVRLLSTFNFTSGLDTAGTPDGDCMLYKAKQQNCEQWKKAKSPQHEKATEAESQTTQDINRIGRPMNKTQNEQLQAAKMQLEQTKRRIEGLSHEMEIAENVEAGLKQASQTRRQLPFAYLFVPPRGED